MKKSSLINKLNKLGISHTIHGNGYNMNVQFTVNGRIFDAGYTINKDDIEDYCTVIGYDKANQESQRSFFKNLNQVLRYANSRK